MIKTMARFRKEKNLKGKEKRIGLLGIFLVTFLKMCNVCPANMEFGRHLLSPLAVTNVNISLLKINKFCMMTYCNNKI